MQLVSHPHYCKLTNALQSLQALQVLCNWFQTNIRNNRSAKSPDFAGTMPLVSNQLNIKIIFT
jgi:hypothetical protein